MPWLCAAILSCSEGPLAARGGYAAELTQASNHTWSGMIRREGTGEVARTITDTDCESVRRATLISLDSIAVRGPKPLSGTPSSAPAVDRSALFLWLRGGVSAGVAPAAQPELDAELAWRWRGFMLRAGLSLLFPVAQTVASGSAEMALYLGTLRASYDWALADEWLRGGGGAFIALGAAQASTRGLDENLTQQTFFAAAGPALIASGLISGRWFWQLEADLPITLVLPRFAVTGYGPILQTQRVGVTVSTGIGVRLW